MKHISRTTCVLLAASALLAFSASQSSALPLIVKVVETGGDDEETDTVTSKYTGETFVNGIANEPLRNTPATASYTVGLFEEEAPMFVDRNHQWNGATTAIPLPKYLVGGEYIMSGNDNRDNADFQLEITIAEEAFVYMLVDDRLGDASNANPPNFPDWTGDRNGDGLPDMAWLAQEGWTPVKSGLNRFGNPDWPDQVGADEGGDGVGPGVAINQWSSIYVKRIPAGTFKIFAPDNNGQNMYGVVIKAVSKTPSVTKSIGDMFGVRFEITEGSQTSLNPSSIKLTLDGNTIVPQVVSKTGNATKVEFTTPALLPPLSKHAAVLSFSDTATPAGTFTEELAFTVEQYGTLTPDLKVTADTSKPGFIWNVFQNAGNQENSTAKAERTVAGELRGADGNLLPNQADPSAVGVASGPATAPNPAHALIKFEIPGVLNVSQAGGDNNGSFPNDDQMPGIPGLEGSTDGIVAEVITYLELPAGLIRMGVNSDDGFHTSAGRVNDAVSRITLGEFSGGRGASDTIFRFVVQEAGVYAFRTLWEEGGGGANIEWFTVKADNSKVLINDTANGGIKAYRAASTPAEPFVRKAFPSAGATGVPADAEIDLEIVDTALQVDPASVVLKLNGATVTPVVAKTGGATKVTLGNTKLFEPNSEQKLELTFKAGATTLNRSWSFRVANYPTLSSSIATSVGSGRDRGFRIRTVQSAAGRANTDAAAEQQLRNNSGAENVADLAAAGADGIFAHSTVINFNQDAPAGIGNFNVDNGFEDQLPPGIPGTTGSNNNFTQEILTFLEFPAAAFVRMGVASDDGFKVTAATGADTNAPVLGIFDGGRGVGETQFAFAVPAAGVYPVRMIWYEGGGGANAEWYSISATGARILVNSDAAGSIKAFRSRSEEPKPTPTISVARSATGLSITFTGKLQSAESVTGPYTDVAGATSPHAVTPTSGVRFYRAAP